MVFKFFWQFLDLASIFFPPIFVVLFFFFFLGGGAISLYCHIGHPQGDLAIFGYRPALKV